MPEAWPQCDFSGRCSAVKLAETPLPIAFGEYRTEFKNHVLTNSHTFSFKTLPITSGTKLSSLGDLRPQCYM